MSIMLNGVKVNRTEFMIWHYEHSITKRKILQIWRRDKHKFLNALIRDKSNQNDPSASYAIQFYKGFKTLLCHSYQEEFPNEEPRMSQLFDWLTDNATICDFIENERDQKTWLDIRKCVQILIDGNLS